MSREAFSPHSKDGEAPAPASSVPSRALKFGMDRILSEDLGRAPAAARRPTHAVQLARTEERGGVGAGSDSCQPCVSSLLRCCRLGGDAAHYLHPFYPGLPPLHNPRPVRPYTNLILESEASERSPLAASNSAAKRKRSWSRAVFSNLQRKGLEKRFQIQKYITKPDRRQLAATLGLTDAQVKVWFQNRRMKWRHSKELKFHTGGFDPSDPRLEPPSPYPSAGPHAVTPSSSSPLWSPTPPTRPPT